MGRRGRRTSARPRRGDRSACAVPLPCRARPQRAVVDSDVSDSDASLGSAAADYAANVVEQDAPGFAPAPDPLAGQFSEGGGVQTCLTLENTADTPPALVMFQHVLSTPEPKYSDDSDDDDDDDDDELDYGMAGKGGDDDDSLDDTSGEESDDSRSAPLGQYAPRSDGGHGENSSLDDDSSRCYNHVHHTRKPSGSSGQSNYVASGKKMKREAEAIAGQMVRSLLGAPRRATEANLAASENADAPLSLIVSDPRCTLVVLRIALLAGRHTDFVRVEDKLVISISGSGRVLAEEEDAGKLNDEASIVVEDTFADRHPGDWSCGGGEGVVRARCEEMLDYFAAVPAMNPSTTIAFPTKRVHFVLEHIAALLGAKFTRAVLASTPDQSGILTVGERITHALTRSEMADLAEVAIQTQCWKRLGRSSGAHHHSREKLGLPGVLGSDESRTRSAAYSALELCDKNSVSGVGAISLSFHKLPGRGEAALKSVADILGLAFTSDQNKIIVIRRFESLSGSGASDPELVGSLENALQEFFPPLRFNRLRLEPSNRKPAGKGLLRLGNRFRLLACHMLDFMSTYPSSKQSLTLAKSHIDICHALVTVAREAHYGAQIIGKGRKAMVFVRGSESKLRMLVRAELEHIVNMVEQEKFGSQMSLCANERRKAKAKKKRKAKCRGDDPSIRTIFASGQGSAAPTIATERGRESLAREFQRAEPIDTRNRGHQLLSRLGWKEGDGLGAQLSGRKDPIRPTFNSGRRGLGGSS
jgi:G-patch domain